MASRNSSLFISLLLSAAAAAAQPSATCRDLRLINGKIVTMDKRNFTVSSVLIHEGRFAAPDTRLNSCAKTINLHGRTVVPGLIDNHNHIVLLGLRPGRDVRLDTAFSIEEAQGALRARARGVPAGEFITAMGGWNPIQFAEKRLPTLAELDAADTAHPIILYQAFTGPASVNTPAKAFFESKNIAVSATGAIAANAPSVAALDALRAAQTFADKKRGTEDAMAYSAKVGVTTNVDMGAFVIPGLPDIQDSFTFDNLAAADPFSMYNAFAALHRDNKMTTRLRIFFLSMDTQMDVPLLKQRMLNTLPNFGDDMMKFSGIGEFATQWPLFGNPAPPPNYETALKLVAKQGWAFQQHSLSLAEDQLAATTFEAVNAVTPIRDLRWSVAHVPRIDQATVNRLKALGAGIALHPFEYLAGAAGAGPPARMIVDSGIHVGAGSDSGQISTLDPWPLIYYLVTGKNSAGVLINDKQQLTRMEALRLYTAENGWFLREEDQLGSIELGKLADLVVLSGDYFDAQKVPDEAIKKLSSVLTIVGGQVVFDAKLL
ncbi:MAG: amidohydrolase family protein [Bryobacterales bacterium]|nr:amidohydrolase family protein [Bryobacterales bacterium]MBV9401754.1 amidohydrolase family protein [Bryobacterales bacterium]